MSVKNTERFAGKPFHSDLPNFKDVIPDKDWRVSKIVLNHGDVIDGIRMVMTNVKTGETKKFGKRGRAYGKKAVIDIPEDDCIRGVTVWNREYMEKI